MIWRLPLHAHDLTCLANVLGRQLLVKIPIVLYIIPISLVQIYNILIFQFLCNQCNFLPIAVLLNSHPLIVFEFVVDVVEPLLRLLTTMHVLVQVQLEMVLLFEIFILRPIL